MSVGQRFGTLANRWSLPAFTRVDAMAAVRCATAPAH